MLTSTHTQTHTHTPHTHTPIHTHEQTISPSTSQQLCQFSDVALIEEDQVVVSEGVHSGEEQKVPYHLDRIDQRHLPLDGTYHPDGNGTGVEIFIFDSGIRYDHEEFGGVWISLCAMIGILITVYDTYM